MVENGQPTRRTFPVSSADAGAPPPVADAQNDTNDADANDADPVAEGGDGGASPTAAEASG